MRRISASVLTILFAMPAFAGATRLPVVNVSAGSVSARAAFGEGPIAPVAPSENIIVASVAVDAPKPTKKLVTRSSKKAAAPTAPVKSIDNGGDIIARADILTPRRPSADLWAKSDAPLRIPTPDEFSVLRSDAELPEEDIAPTNKNVAPRIASNEFTNIKPSDTPMTEIDNQIARLVELQRRVDEGAKKTSLAADVDYVPREAPVVASSVATRKTRAAVMPIKSDDAIATTKTDDVKLTRMVVPMTPDVVVRTVEKNTSPRITAVRDDMSKMSPTELRKAFRKTFLSENKHLSTFQIDDRFDVASDMSASVEGFTARRDLSEGSGIRPLEIKIRFKNDDSALSRDNYNLLTEYASIVVSNPKRAIQVSIPQNATRNADNRKLAARRLAIVEQVLRDTGVSEQRILPVLSQRDEEGFVLRIISGDQYETLTQKQRDMFGDTVGKKTYKSMSW